MSEPKKQWVLMGHDTFGRHDYVVGTFATREEAEAALREKEAQHEKTQDVSLRDELWVEERHR
ncbi:MAG: hypothetical protein JNK82_35235 [Myxococcaceae bacterium]|nr:hypothetical protein [Myxococcaceae bacterium]